MVPGRQKYLDLGNLDMGGKVVYPLLLCNMCHPT